MTPPYVEGTGNTTTTATQCFLNKKNYGSKATKILVMVRDITNNSYFLFNMLSPQEAKALCTGPAPLSKSLKHG